MDPFDHLFAPVPTASVRAGGKFQPKIKQRPRKEIPALVPSLVPCDRAKQVDGVLVSGSDVAENGTGIQNSSCLVSSVVSGIGEPWKVCEESVLGVQVTGKREDLGPVGSRIPESDVDYVNLFIQDSKEVGSSNVSMIGLDIEAASQFGDVEKSATENADIFYGLEYLEDIITQTTTDTGYEGSQSQPEVDTSVKHAEKVLTSYCDDNDLGGSTSPLGRETCSVEDFSAHAHCSFGSSEFTIYDYEVPVDKKNSETKVTRTSLDFETRENTGVSGQRAGKFKPRPKLRKEIDKPCTDDSHAESVSSLPSEDVLHEGPILEFPQEDTLDYSSVRLGDSLVTPPKVNGNEEARSFTEAIHSQSTCLGDPCFEEDHGNVAVQTKTACEVSAESNCLKKRKRFSTNSKEVEGGKSRQLKKWLRQIVEEPEDEDQSRDDPIYEPPSTSNRDEGEDEDEDDDDEENRVDASSAKRKAPKKVKETVSGNEKPAPKRKNAKKSSEESIKEPPKKKFSHSSRRNKRTVDKALLDIPEDELDTQRLPIKDLILLAEHRERMMVKDAAAKLKTPQTNQSADDSLRGDDYHNEEESLSEHGHNSDEDQPSYKPTALFVNYQTYMNKTPTTRWSKLDTELFYEAIRQFGTDFSMIQQLFPNRTRHQVKLKYKSEERQHPLRLSEAATNRAKDHTYFESVIERLQQAAIAKQESFGHDSVVITEEDDIRETAHETNEEVTKPNRNDEAVKEQEADVVEVQNSPLKSYESDDDDDLDKWNQYNY